MYGATLTSTSAKKPATAVRVLLPVLLAFAAGVGVPVGAMADELGVDAPQWVQQRSAILHLDNDLFGVSNRDRDYTGGLAISVPQTTAPALWNPERWLGSLAQSRNDDPVLRALQVQIIAFSPGELERSDVLDHDRPYASLWALSGARQRIGNGGREATFAALTVGALGLSATEAVHRALHRATGTELPAGYDHQISAGGEPTAKLTVARRRLLAGGEIGPGADLWWSVAGSVGYLTEASLALAARFGDRGTPWWTNGAELADHAAAPDFGIAALGGERTLEAGVRVSARAYNAFLLGQFRHSDLRVDRSEIEPVIATAWIGLTVATLSGTRIAYRLSARSPEVRSGPASRVHFWGSISWSRAF